MLALSLQQPPLPAHIYRYIVGFIASNPTPQQIAAFSPTAEMQLDCVLYSNAVKLVKLPSFERVELDEYERIEHLIIMLKAGNCNYLNTKS